MVHEAFCIAATVRGTARRLLQRRHTEPVTMVVLLTLIFLVIVAAAVSAVVTQSMLRGRHDPSLGPPNGAIDERLRRLEATVEALSAEMDRMSEGQRFLTDVLAQRGRLPPPDEPEP